MLKIIITLLIFNCYSVFAQDIVNFSPADKELTTKLRNAIENAHSKNIKLNFEKGIYKFSTAYALDRYSCITNHGNGLKKVIFRLDGFDSVEIEGNGSEFIFHGLVAPFQFENCKKVSVNNVTIDYDIPLVFQAKVLKVNKDEGWMDVKPFTDGYSWTYKNKRILFPNIDGFNFNEFGHGHVFDEDTKFTAHGAHGLHLYPEKIDKIDDNTYRFHENLKHFPPEGSIIVSKGGNGQNRYAPAFQFMSSSNIAINKVVVHFALGMGFLFERSDTIKITNSGVYTRDGSNRYISSSADATHFANCKGEVLIENCRIESMLDDGTNVHGTYVKIDKILDTHTVKVALYHFEQLGFKFAEKGDEVWFIQHPNPQRGQVNEVVSVKQLNEKYTELTFKNKLPENLTTKDVIENKTWNPIFTMRGCKITRHRARNMMLKTPHKTIIEDNYLSSEMSSVMLRGETVNWYESGAVGDLQIRNNHFVNCAHGGAEHAVFYIAPKLSKNFDQTATYDKNIVFENNTIETFDNRIVWAKNAENLIIRNNKIVQTKDRKQLFPKAPLFEFENCKNVEIYGNTYNGSETNSIVSDKSSKSAIKIKKNKGFKNLKL